MAVKDFMTRKVVYISPDTTVAHAADLMREQGLHRLPVIENDQLVGLVTEGTIAEASPSKATSLSIYEMNYLLNKTKVKDVMIRDVVTVSGYASLEDATYLMLKNKIGILPVVDNHQVYGVITDRDVFQAFLEIAGYGEEGIRVRFITENEVGVLGKIVALIVEEDLNISHTVNIPRKDGKVVIEVQIDGKIDLTSLKDKFEKEGIQPILNMPSATCSVTIPEIRKLGGHQGEPGHALTGTTPLHAVQDLPEIPALVYVSEISHNLDGHSYFYGGGYYRRGHFENVEVVNGDNVVFDTVLPLKDESIDYYIETKNEHPVGATVIGSFRTQIFVTRSDLAIVSGLQSGNPHLVGIYDSLGNKVRR